MNIYHAVWWANLPPVYSQFKPYREAPEIAEAKIVIAKWLAAGKRLPTLNQALAWMEYRDG